MSGRTFFNIDFQPNFIFPDESKVNPEDTIRVNGRLWPNHCMQEADDTIDVEFKVVKRKVSNGE